MSRTGFAPRERFLWTSARIATGALFVAAGLAKLFAPMATAEVVASRHMFSPATVGTAVALFEVVCGGLLIITFHTR